MCHRLQGLDTPSVRQLSDCIRALAGMVILWCQTRT